MTTVAAGGNQARAAERLVSPQQGPTGREKAPRALGGLQLPADPPRVSAPLTSVRALHKDGG